MAKNLRAGALLLLALSFLFARLQGQATNAAPAAASTNAPAATPPAVAVPLANVALTAVDDSNKLQQIQGAISGDPTVAEVERALADSVKNVARQKPESDKMLLSSPSLPSLRNAQELWQMQADALAGPQETLANRVAQLDGYETELHAMSQKWLATRAAAKSAAAPTDTLSRIDGVTADIGQVDKAASSLRAQLLSTQNKVVTQSATISTELAAIKNAQRSAIRDLFVRDSPPIWALSFAPAVSSATTPALSAAVAPAPAPPELMTEVSQLRAFIAEKFPAALLHLVIFNVLALVLFWVRRMIDTPTKDNPTVQHAAQVLDSPIAVAAVLALLLSAWFYPLAPRLFWAGLFAAALIPAVIILRRLIEPSLFPILYAMVVSYFVDQLRRVLEAQPVAERLVFLAEMIGAVLFLVWLVRSRRLSQTAGDLLEMLVRLYAYVALIVFSFALVVNFLGYTGLSYHLGFLLICSYLAVIFYAGVRIADGLILAACRIRPFSLLGMVRRHGAQVAGYASLVVRWFAFAVWVLQSLEIFSIRSDLWNRAATLLTFTDNQGLVHATIFGRILLFGLIVWVTFQLSRLIRFVLEEEVYPNFRLGPGVPYAISTMVHYLVLILGFITALDDVGIDLSKYALLVSALGVGLGFGLQNIMNNFVSGIILLFERPIKVGDVIQVDTAMGTVESIGIRASVIRITNGSEIIMPNGNLISSQVTNWTFSDRRRAIDIPIVVAAKADPQKVMNVLTATAKAHPLVLKDPPPRVLFTNFTGAGLNFELRAWTDSTESWGQVRSELALAISAALAREDIAVI